MAGTLDQDILHDGNQPEIEQDEPIQDTGRLGGSVTGQVIDESMDESDDLDEALYEDLDNTPIEDDEVL